MKQFFEAYHELFEREAKPPVLLTEISWSNHLHILSKTKNLKEKQYYLELTFKNNYSARDLARLINSGAFERTLLEHFK